MPDCVDLIFDGSTVEERVIEFGGVSADGTIHVGYNIFNGTIASLTNLTTHTTIYTSANAITGGPSVDDDDRVWFVESADFVTFTLRHCALDGSGVTTAGNITGIPAFTFESPDPRYDPFADRFWFTYGASSGRGLWTLSKTGTAVRRYIATKQAGWGAIVTDDAACWARYEDNVVRVDGSSFASTVITVNAFGSRYVPSLAAGAGSGGGVLSREDFPVATKLYEPGGSSSDADCDLNDLSAFAFGTAYSSLDFTSNFYSHGNGCPYDSLIWQRLAEAEEDVPPLRLYFRDDARSVSGARQNLTATSIQETPRIRQGAGYL